MSTKYDTIGKDYNATRKADPFIAQQLFEMLNPKAENLHLDIGCGTGNYTIALQQKGMQFIAVDPSEHMLSKAKSKNSSVDWRPGSAEALPIHADSMDGALATLTLHHWSSLVAGFLEVNRALKPNSKFLIFTSDPLQMKGYWLNHYFPKMLEDSIAQMPSLASIETALEAANFSVIKKEKYFIQPDLQDCFLYCGKQQPELYLSPAIRQGISSFSALANVNEIDIGLTKLSADITSGKIKNIMELYDNEMGDYIFLLAES